MEVCNCSMFCFTLLCVRSSIAIILMGKRELIALLNLSSWCLVMVEGLFLAVPLGCLQFVIVVFPDHTHLLLLTIICMSKGQGIYICMSVILLTQSTTSIDNQSTSNDRLKRVLTTVLTTFLPTYLPMFTYVDSERRPAASMFSSSSVICSADL